jgi:glycosyltransferase involved in cell wall biosynthesis
MGIQKIAILTHDVEGGTFANLATTLAMGFTQLGLNCDVVVLNVTEETRQRYPSVNIVSLNARRTILSIPHIRRYIREHQPNVVFPMPWYFNVMAVLARSGLRSPTKVVLGEHNVCSLEATIEHRNNPRIRYILPVLMRYSYPYANGLIGVSKDTLTDLVDEFKISPHLSMRVISNPINPDRIQHQVNAPLNHPWFQDQTIPVVLTAARLSTQKQLDVLIRAFAKVVKSVPARLVILGEGPLRQDLETLCQELEIVDQVEMPGFERNPYRFMATCGVFVLASAWEGCPISLQEAMTCGAPVIVNDAPGGSKDIVDYGHYGMMVPNGNIDALSNAIVKILTDSALQEHYRQQSRLRAQDFLYLQICQQYVDFAQSLPSHQERKS